MFHNYRADWGVFKPRRFFLVFNKLAGRSRQDSVQDVLSLARDYRIEFERIYVLPDDELNFDFVRDDVVFIRGGDGTTHHFLTEIMTRGKEIPMLAHIYGGSMCTVEKCLRVPDRVKLIKKVSDYLRDGRFIFIPRPSIEICFGDERKYGFLFGAILPATFLRDYYSYGETGPKTAVRTVSKYVRGVLLMDKDIIKKFKSEKVRLISKDFSIEKDFYLIGASTVHSFGLNFSTFPKAPKCSSGFNLIATSLFPLFLVFFLPLIYFGVLPPNSLNVVLDEIKISFDSEKDFTIDGDIYSAKDLVLRTGPVVRFIV